MSRRQRVARLCQRSGVLPWIASLSPLRGENLRILAYHRVLELTQPEGFSFDLELLSASQQDFHEQMVFVRKYFSPMRFDEVIERIERGRRLPRKAVLVTLDDGYDDNHRIVFPILKDCDVSAMFFVSTGHVDNGNPYAYDWLVHVLCTARVGHVGIDRLGIACPMPGTMAGRRELAATVLNRLKALDDAEQRALITHLSESWGVPMAPGHPDCRPMSWDMVREMQRSGMEIGAHSVNHAMLSKLSLERMRAEVLGSAAALERELGSPAYAMSYPVGGPDAYNQQVIEAVREAGFRIACTYMPGVASLARESVFELSRLPVEREMDVRWFQAMLSVPGIFGYPLTAPKR